MFVPSSVNDSVTAFDLETGRERWRFYAQGPVRFPAVADQGRVYFVSDDGYLYCLDGSSGGLLWKFRGGPDQRRVLGNGRLISAWPARGGPVVADGKVYFAAGMWPSQGVFVHALDSATGRVVWTNDGSGSQETEQPHGGVAANGPSPQGCLVLAGDKLLVPCGRTYPAVFDARDGRLLAYQMGQREEVGCQVVAAGGYFFCGASAALSEQGSFELLHRDGYSQECDVLVSAEVRQANYGEGFVGDEFIVRKGTDGSVLWKASRLDGPVILHHQTLYATAAFSNGTALDLRTGQPKLCAHPLTGEPIPWRCPRAYGCNVPIGGEHLLTFRSATSAYCSLTTDSGTVSLGGFRAGCSNTLIPAGGLLNAPNYAYGCLCNFQNDTSLALVPTPDAEAWGRTALPPITRAVRRLGLNFGAPGDRPADDGTLWLACGEKLDGPVTVRVEADAVRPFRWHPSRVEGAGPRWVAASGIDGVRKISVDLSPADGPPVRYRVALYFVEPQAVAAGERVFDIAVQGEIVARGFDIVGQAGDVRRAVRCQWEGVLVRGRLEIAFLPHAGAKISYAAVSGVEIRSEADLLPR